MHILPSGPELKVVRFGYVILGENGKKANLRATAAPHDEFRYFVAPTPIKLAHP